MISKNVDQTAASVIDSIDGRKANWNCSLLANFRFLKRELILEKYSHSFEAENIPKTDTALATFSPPPQICGVSVYSKN